MEEKQIIKTSVRNLVEFILRSGDIDNRRGKAAEREAMQEGSRIHRKIQRRMGADYLAEVPLKLTIEKENYVICVEGRADGIIRPGWTEDDTIAIQGESSDFSESPQAETDSMLSTVKKEQLVTIDEIKGIYRDVNTMEEPVSVHLAQAKCYAYIYGLQHDLPAVRVRMTYCNLDTEQIRYFYYEYSFQELKHWFEDLLLSWQKWADFQYEWRQIRQTSYQELEFPFTYREGQRKLVGDVYRTLMRRKILFLQAPTGVGKTISTVFPAVKAVGEGLGDKIFYLTAKTITRTVAKDTFSILKERGMQSKVLEITAKEKMCFCDEVDCNPESCPYAKGHYDRVNDAVFDLISKENELTRDAILKKAEEFTVCPFELCLDVSLWSDVIICDYNYVFDPNIYLKRFFAEGNKGDYFFLVDEAHNLVERGRKMYSALLIKEDLLHQKKLLKSYSQKLTRLLEACNKQMLEWKRECEHYTVYDNIGSFIFSLMRLGAEYDNFLQNHAEFPERKEISEFYLNLRHFMNMYEVLDENYVIYTDYDEDGKFCLQLYCVNPAANLQERLNRGLSTVYFSATLLPIQYYKQLLSSKDDNYAVYATSVFSEKQRLLAVGRDVSSLYTRRNTFEFRKIASYIYHAASGKQGNYLVFFPSYKLMQQVYEQFLAIDPGKMDCLVQESNMTEDARESFIEEFAKDRETSLVAFGVLGGIFSEGIDLKNEQLIGVLIVGTGLPQICTEREILKQYYQDRQGQGFAYAYLYPGMNKVLQAAGRVIRTAEDRGVILLLDERFLRKDYQELFPREWKEYRICSLDTVAEAVDDFWNGSLL